MEVIEDVIMLVFHMYIWVYKRIARIVNEKMSGHTVSHAIG